MAIIVNVAFKGSTLAVDVDLHEPSAAGLRIQFEGVVGYRVLDERDLPQFWQSAQNDGASNGCMLYEVTSGGWADEHKAQSPIMAEGFYSPLREWIVLSDDWCVSVLSQGRGEPGVSKR
jgi:hypothetical protein